MKLLLVLMVCAVAAAAPKVRQVESLQLGTIILDFLENETPETNSILVNALVRQLIAYLRRIINNGSALFGIPPLDPLELDEFHLYIPAGLINLDLDLKGIRVAGVGGFVVHKSDLNLRDMTFDLDISVPTVDIRADEYDLTGDLFTAFPLYGKGQARFVVEGFRYQVKLFLKQSEDEKSVVIEKIENLAFEIPVLKSELTGAIGGGDIDGIVNAMVENVILDYVNRFQGAISTIASPIATDFLNPLLDQLDTWKYIAPLIPRA